MCSPESPHRCRPVKWQIDAGRVTQFPDRADSWKVRAKAEGTLVPQAGRGAVLLLRFAWWCSGAWAAVGDAADPCRLSKRFLVVNLLHGTKIHPPFVTADAKKRPTLVHSPATITKHMTPT